MHFSYFRMHVLFFNSCIRYRFLFVYPGSVSTHSFVVYAYFSIWELWMKKCLKIFTKAGVCVLVFFWVFLKLKKLLKIEKATTKFSAQGIGFSCARGGLCWVLGKGSTWKGLSSIEWGCLGKCIDGVFRFRGGLAVLGLWLDSMLLKVFSSLYNSMIAVWLCFKLHVPAGILDNNLKCF